MQHSIEGIYEEVSLEGKTGGKSDSREPDVETGTSNVSSANFYILPSASHPLPSNLATMIPDRTWLSIR